MRRLLNFIYSSPHEHCVLVDITRNGPHLPSPRRKLLSFVGVPTDDRHALVTPACPLQFRDSWTATRITRGLYIINRRVIRKYYKFQATSYLEVGCISSGIGKNSPWLTWNTLNITINP